MSFRFDFARTPEFIDQFDDFLSFDPDDWVITTTEAGAGSASESLSGERGGVLVVTNDAADGDADFLQWAGGAGAVTPTARFAAGRKLYFGIRFRLSDAVRSDFIAGLAVADATPLGHSDGAVFRKAAGQAGVDFHLTKESVGAQVATEAGLVDGSYATLEFYHDGGTSVALYMDGATIGSAPVDTLPDTAELAVTLGIVNGEAVAKALSVDWLRLVQER